MSQYINFLQVSIFTLKPFHIYHHMSFCDPDTTLKEDISFIVLLVRQKKKKKSDGIIKLNLNLFIEHVKHGQEYEQTLVNSRFWQLK